MSCHVGDKILRKVRVIDEQREAGEIKPLVAYEKLKKVQEEFDLHKARCRSCRWAHRHT